jgi:hypothetical protein
MLTGAKAVPTATASFTYIVTHFELLSPSAPARTRAPA